LPFRPHTFLRRKSGPQRAFDEPETRLGQGGEDDDPDKIANEGVSEPAEHGDSDQDVP
jgi:hypothetical protein